MNSQSISMLKIIVLLTVLLCMSCESKSKDPISERVKVALRDVGHHLLLSDEDSTSVVQPVVALGNDTFQLTFENELSIHPDTLVDRVKNSFQKAGLPAFYLTEVQRCEDKEVSYSYEMKQDMEKGIIPCKGRNLDTGCYFITVQFTQPLAVRSQPNVLVYSLALLGFAILILLVYRNRKKSFNKTFDAEATHYESLGRFRFYPEQNKLIKEATEISLSRKECELLAIFAARPNQIIKREELSKKVWEDNGVIVGRSLDTYISKLRNKLKEDASIQITNVHGVGYKLEID